jgi:hypothetical protein
MIIFDPPKSINFKPHFGHLKSVHFYQFYGGGVDGPKICQNLGVQKCPKVDFCYIVVSTIFGPSGPPPDPPKSDIFWPPLEQKYSLFVGNDIFNSPFIGVDFGVEKWGSFCKKCGIFKKFINWPPRTPPAQKSRFLMILDPPMAWQFLTFFSSIFDPPKVNKIWWFLTSDFRHL